MKTTEVSTVTNTYFSGLPDKTKVRIAGVIKKIDDKETSSGTAKRFKGDLAVQNADEVYLARYGFFPTPIRDAIISGAQKLGKWSSFEFCLSVQKTSGGNSSWNVSFDLAPRVEMPRVLALLEE